ncbi:MAG: ribonuclease III [Patescibacteria group bacterium]
MIDTSTILPVFNNPDLLVTALTHRSALNEHLSTSKESNERFEFLGDAVLELCATNFLFKELPEEQEGTLTSYRSALVKTTTLAEIAEEMGLSESLYMSKGEKRTNGHHNPSLLADTFEALLGAIYLDQGYDAVFAFLNEKLFPRFEMIQKNQLHRDFKSSFQELVQAQGKPTPTYSVLAEKGPDHQKEFTVGVFIEQEKIAEASGASKQKAEEAAAKVALEKLKGK